MHMGVDVMDIDTVYKELLEVIPQDHVLLNEPMKKHTSFRIGGPADIMVFPSELNHIRWSLSMSKKHQIPIFVMGNGTNLLVRDKGIRGIVLKIAEKYSQIWVEGQNIRAQAGVLLSKLSNAALQAGLTGLEFASGIPGSLGGAIAMNAGAYGGEMKDVVQSVTAMDDKGNEYYLQSEDIRFGYRRSIIQDRKWIVLEVSMYLDKGDYEKSKAFIADLSQRRREKQPLSFPSAGSVFKRPVGYYTGKLIEDAGLKGMRCGDAQVSKLHANFIINLGNATSDDVLSLIDMVKQKVKEQFGVEMIPEIRVVGEE